MMSLGQQCLRDPFVQGLVPDVLQRDAMLWHAVSRCSSSFDEPASLLPHTQHTRTHDAYILFVPFVVYSALPHIHALLEPSAPSCVQKPLQPSQCMPDDPAR